MKGMLRRAAQELYLSFSLMPECAAQECGLIRRTSQDGHVIGMGSCRVSDVCRWRGMLSDVFHQEAYRTDAFALKIDLGRELGDEINVGAYLALAQDPCAARRCPPPSALVSYLLDAEISATLGVFFNYNSPYTLKTFKF